jgi:hypothetical protein
MAIDVVLKLDDLGLFKRRRKHEQLSQHERACQVRDQFAQCMKNALRWRCCIMPEYCAHGSDLACEHLIVDYSNFSGAGIRLTGSSQKLIDARLRAIGTLVFRRQTGFKGPVAGDIHVPALARISTFPAPSESGSSKHAPAGKDRGFLRLLGFV